MKIVLIKDVANVGKAGEIKNVANGFARNFLFPSNLAEMASEENVEKAKAKAKEKVAQEETDLTETQKLADQLDGRELIITAKAENEKLFGKISPRQIMEQLKSDGIEISEKHILIEKPIKEIGEFPVKIKLDHQIEVEIKVIVEVA